MSLGLLGHYDSSSDSSSSSEEDEERQEPAESAVTTSLANPFKATSSPINLPKPSFLTEQEDSTAAPKAVGASASVFANPFRDKEDRKRALLEKHVAMTTKPEDQRVINGKKVCWNYRKGRCRFGHNCTFAHDSDIGLRKRAVETADKRPDFASAPSASAPGQSLLAAEEDSSTDGGPAAGRKKRPGLAEGLVPGKKAMKFHNKVYNAKE